MPNLFPLALGNKYHELFGMLFQTRNVLYKLDKKKLNSLEISPEQSTILLLVQVSPEPLTPTQISRHLLREPHTIAVNLKRMQIKGLISLEQDPKWKNRKRVKLTEKGQEIYEKSSDPEFFQSAFQALSEEEFNQLKSILKKLFASGMKKLKSKDTDNL